MTSPQEKEGRFPFGVPFSWYHVADCDELAPGDVRRLRAFGRDLVLFRGEDGEAGLLDAYCPHLGAHLGEGGCVVGAALECPFHGWRWRADGSCAHIPYAKRIPSAARANAYPISERFGMVFAWYHPRGESPLFEVPEIPEWGRPDWSAAWKQRSIELATHPQEIAENGPDWRHLAKVHAMEMEEQDFVFEPEGYGYRWYLGGQVSAGASTLQGANYGVGLSTFRQGGVHQAIVITTVTPIEVDRLRFNLAMLSQSSEAEIDTQFDYHWAFAEPDFRIWEHKAHHEQPLLCEEDGPITQFRSWAAQFY